MRQYSEGISRAAISCLKVPETTQDTSRHPYGLPVCVTPGHSTYPIAPLQPPSLSKARVLPISKPPVAALVQQDSQTAMDRKRIVHQLDTPYSTVQWPQVSHDDQETILELLCSLLSPLGHHRRSFITPSKGKRANRKKLQAAQPEAADNPIPPVPEVARDVDLGLANISRSLEKVSARCKQNQPEASDATGQDGVSTESTPEPYAVVFVARSGQPSAFHSHFPQMVAVASKGVPSKQPVRLVGFSAACEDRLSTALAIPRVSSIGLREGAPQTKALIEFVREHVPPVEMSWFQEAESGRFLETKINAVEVSIGNKKQKT